MKRMPAHRPALGSQEKLAVLRCDFRSLPQQIATAASIRESAFGCARSVCRWSQFDPLRSLARFGPNGSVVPLGDIPPNSIPDRQHHQSGILNAITESRLDGVAMIHFEGRHAPPPQTRARGADGSVGGAVQVEAVEQVVGVSVALPQRRQAVTGLDHLQDRGGVVERVIHEAAPGER